MSEATQILFNSSALSSLKRDQLVKLCKIHSIKTSGKKVDLVQRLKDYASTLPPDDPLRAVVRIDDDEELDSKRPSDQWEIVMEDILEVPEPSRTTLSSLRSVTSNAPDEFGTGGESKSSSVSSSLKAMANSFNFKRATSVKSSDSQTSYPTYPKIPDELASHSVPYSSIPEASLSDMPQTDHFKFSTPDSTMQEHIQSPSPHPRKNATTNPTASPSKTTIRLVSASAVKPSLSQEPGTPLLKPVDPEFDLVTDSPGAKGQSHVPVWPLSPPPERLYPALPAEELEHVEGETKSVPSQLAAGSTSKRKVYPRPSNIVQDLFSPAPKPPSVQKESLGIPRSEPFLFGSPLPRNSVSNKDFDAAAASVLEEMNKRLSAAGVQKVDADVFGGSAIAKTANATSLESSNLRKMDRFDKVHEERFNKMDSIATHYAAKRGSFESKKRKSDVLGHGSAPGNKRSSTDTRGPRTRMGIPGGFGDDAEEEKPLPDDVQEEGDRRMSKRVRLLEGDGGKDKGRRLTMSPRKTEAEEKQTERERAATRKMLDARKEKRRSSRHGRVSTAGPQASNNKGKAKPRFGFFSSAKSIVRSVWNFGAGSPTKASRSTTTTTTEATATEPQEAKPGPPKKPSFPACRPSGAPLSGKSIAPTRIVSASSKAQATVGTTGGDSSRSRPPSSTFGSQNYKNNTRSTDLSNNTAAKRSNPTPASSTNSRRSVLAGSANNASSLGTKGSLPRSSATNSLSAGSQRRAVPASTGNATEAARDESAAEGSNKAATGIFSPSRTTATSRLFAPTASSLAKTRATGSVTKSRTSSIVAQRAKTPPPRNSALDAITNSPRGGGEHASKIFSTPLLAVPPPVRPTSLAVAAAALVASGGRSTTSPERASSTTKSQQTRKPRISRSRVIAKLGAQRAAAAASTSTTPSASSLSRPAAASRIPARVSAGSAARTLRVRSSMGTAARRSYAGAKSASRGSDVLMSAKKHMRQSEYVRRRSRLAGSAVGAGAIHVADGPDGTMAMDIDDD